MLCLHTTRTRAKCAHTPFIALIARSGGYGSRKQKSSSRRRRDEDEDYDEDYDELDSEEAVSMVHDCTRAFGTCNCCRSSRAAATALRLHQSHCTRILACVHKQPQRTRSHIAHCILMHPCLSVHKQLQTRNTTGHGQSRRSQALCSKTPCA